jgi:hypothetical protein
VGVRAAVPWLRGIGHAGRECSTRWRWGEREGKAVARACRHRREGKPVSCASGHVWLVGTASGNAREAGHLGAPAVWVVASLEGSAEYGVNDVAEGYCNMSALA